MENSFSLGLIHGALYGITPITPWFIGLKRYVFEGQTKDLIKLSDNQTGVFLKKYQESLALSTAS